MTVVFGTPLILDKWYLVIFLLSSSVCKSMLTILSLASLYRYADRLSITRHVPSIVKLPICSALMILIL
ncbi:hypothetical protein [Diplocloster agilis]|uniref:hypothetical protein n=1 Tax=Diplocloster agilis TaxID=2850323 RepID=UPI002265BE82|nr:hypothetical protein [Suonthocola fibrivorans]MCU6732321.1 hypothetical protein [Suonthocola fibrivorans]